VGQSFNVFAQPVGIEPLDRVDDGGMKCTTALLDQTRVSDLVDQRMFECVFNVGEQSSFVKEFGRLEA
jgi:hypothetical protein